MPRGRKVVPGCEPAIEQWKYEIAAELGLPVGPSNGWIGADTEFAGELGTAPVGLSQGNYWGNLSTRDAGTVGGTITARLIRQAEQSLRS